MSYQLIIFNSQGAQAELRHDSGLIAPGVPAVHPSGRQGIGFDIPDGTPNGHGFQLVLTVSGKTLVQRGILYLRESHFPYPWTDGQTAAAAMDDFTVPSASGSLPLGAATLLGRHGFVLADGRRYPLVGATGFKLISLVADGKITEASRFLSSLGPNRTVRILTMAEHLFHLDPDRGRAFLLATLDLLQDHGHYGSVVTFADTGSYSSMDFERHAMEVGALCDGHPAAIFNELGNELYALHPTQDDRLGDVTYLKHLRTHIPTTLPVSLGSTHGGNDESEIFEDGDLLTIHGDRQNGDQIPGGDSAGWRWVRHTNEQRAYGDRVRKYPVNDEPRRDDLAPDKHLGMALLCRLMGIGDTFHFRGGLFCEPPTGAELLAFDARQRGWDLIPPEWVGEYRNAGQVGSPVKSFDRAIRIYSSIRGGSGYSLVLGGEAGLRIDWNDSWPTRTLVHSEGACQLWQVTQ